ncbi:MAG: insulinase family protein [Ruminococcus sp.]|nr:insulinase family protein [Candidatus Apopatosoma intestinale]
MSFTRKEIAKNVFVNTVATDKFKSDFIRIAFVMPLSKEKAAANALVPYVLKRGTEKYPDIGAIRRQLESLYDSGIWANIGKRGDTQIININAGMLANKYSMDGTDITGGMLEMISQMLFHPVLESGTFRSEYVESEKAKLADAVRADANNKIAYANRRVREEMYRGEAYAESEKGSAETISALTPERVYAAYLDLLANARIEISAVGNMDFDKVTAAFEAMFAGVCRGAGYDLKTEVVREPKGEPKTVYEHQNIGQGKLALGFRAGCCREDDDFLVMQMVSVIFGGSTSSKLFMNVRERLSLCYYCSAGYDAVKGAIFVNSGIEFAKKKQAISEIIAQLESVKRGEISDTEISDAKNTLINSLRSITDKTSQIAGWCFECAICGISETPEERMAKINAITKEQIVARAQSIKLDTIYFLCGTEVAEDE